MQFPFYNTQILIKFEDSPSLNTDIKTKSLYEELG